MSGAGGSLDGDAQRPETGSGAAPNRRFANWIDASNTNHVTRKAAHSSVKLWNL